MCVVSMIGDVYKDKWSEPGYPWTPTTTWPVVFTRQVTPEEFDALKAEVEHMKKLLIAAKIYDEQTGQPDCEMEDKVALLKGIAELMGVSLEEVFGK
jgi:hypothetical protein